MAAAASLIQAAGQAGDNLYPWWIANSLKTKLGTFSATCLALFPEMEGKSHPSSNWCILMSNLSNLMPSSNVPFATLQTATQYVYRMCLMTSQLRTQTLISAAQANAVLASYNLQF